MRNLSLIIASVALGLSGAASAETFNITGGNWESQSSWNTNATGDPSPLVYDNGEQIQPAILANTPGIVNWNPDTNLADGTYSGTIETNQSGEVISGSLVVTGLIGNEVQVNNSSWWAHEYTNLVIDFGAGTATATVYTCLESGLAPAACAAGGDAPPEGIFTPVAGEEGIGGAVRPGATFDGTTLIVFREDYSAPGSGTDYMNTFTLTVGGGGPEVVAPLADVTEAGAAGGDGDFALLELSSTTGPSGSVNPQVRVLDGKTGSEAFSIEYFDQSAEAWQPIAIDTVSDGNSDGTADDPAVVMLAQNLVSGQIKVQARYISNGTKVRTNIPFFSSTNWSPIDVAVVNDINGDGTTGDTGIAVLAQSGVDSRWEVRMTPLGTVNNLPTFTGRYFSPTDVVKGIEATTDAGDSLIIALGVDGAGKSRLQGRQVSDGASLGNLMVWGAGASVDATDLSIVADADGNGTADDPAAVVLGLRDSNSNTIYRSLLISDGSDLGTNRLLSSPFAPERITSTDSIVGAGGEEIAASAINTGDDALRVKLRAFSDNASISDLDP